MGAHPNEELLRRGYAAFSAGDMDTLRDVIAQDAVYHIPGRSPQAGDYQGIDAILAFFVGLFQITGGTFKVEVHDVLANDDHAVALQRTSAQRPGKTLDFNDVFVFNVRDGKAVEAWFHPGDLYGTDEFWSD